MSIAAIIISVLAILISLLNLLRGEPIHHHIDMTKEGLPERTPQGLAEYVCTLTDWGPDFTGEGEVLARWRWVLTRFETGAHMMVGNCMTKEEAEHAAAQWLAGWDSGADMVVDNQSDPQKQS